MELHAVPQKDVRFNENIYDQYHTVYDMEDGWLPGNKERNFRFMLRLPEYINEGFDGTSVLDVGCGTGDFFGWLIKRGVKKYVGVDIYAPSLGRARGKYPSADFRWMDILSGSLRERFDYAFSSGSLSTRLSVDNYMFFRSMVQTMYNQVQRGVVFNVLSDTGRHKAPYIFYYSYEAIKDICSDIAGRENTVFIEDHTGQQIHGYIYRRGYSPSP